MHRDLSLLAPVNDAPLRVELRELQGIGEQAQAGLTTEAGPSFRRVKGPTPAALDLLVPTRSDRIARHLKRRGLRVRDPENDSLTLGASDDSTVDELRGHSIPYRMALGPHAGRKAFTLQTLLSSSEFERGPLI